MQTLRYDFSQSEQNFEKGVLKKRQIKCRSHEFTNYIWMLRTAEFTLTLCRFASKSCFEKYLRTFILFLRFWRKNKMNVHEIFSKYDIDAKRQRVSLNPAVRNISYIYFTNPDVDSAILLKKDVSISKLVKQV
jgi:hypothetical protein